MRVGILHVCQALHKSVSRDAANIHTNETGDASHIKRTLEKYYTISTEILCFGVTCLSNVSLEPQPATQAIEVIA